MHCLIFADNLLKLVSSEWGLTHAIDWFSAAFDQARMKISTKNWGIMSLKKPKAVYPASELQYTAAGGEVQVAYLVFTNDGRWNKDNDTQICKENAVLHEFYHSMVTKLELSKITKLSVFKSVFVSIPAYGHEFWVMTERMHLKSSGRFSIGFRGISRLGSAIIVLRWLKLAHICIQVTSLHRWNNEGINHKF